MSPRVAFDSFFNVINGKLTTTDTTRYGINPATGEPNPPVPVSTPSDVDAAVNGAKEAFPAWVATPWKDRQTAILGFADALEEQKEDFAQMLTTEQGKPLKFALSEVDTAVKFLRGIAGLDLPEETVREDENVRVVVRYVPLGVAVGIVPWNYPIVLACGKIAAALLTGNAFILKPSPFTPYCDLKLAELGQHFFPPGVFQALSGDDSLGPWLTAHPGPDKISFTGSVLTGKKVMESASKTLKRVTLELGGNDGAIICADANIDAVAPTLATFAFLNAGQLCVAVKRIYVHESIYEKFRDSMVAYAKTLRMTPEPHAFLGPIQNHVQYERVNGFLDDIEREQFTLALGDRETPKTGYYIKPTIVDNPRDDSRIVQEEPFGPVVPILKWSTEDEVISRINKTNVGLGASVWSSNLAEAERLARKIEAGNIWINAHAQMEPTAPFAGHKNSGIGCEFGLEGLKGFCNLQTLYLKK